MSEVGSGRYSLCKDSSILLTDWKSVSTEKVDQAPFTFPTTPYLTDTHWGLLLDTKQLHWSICVFSRLLKGSSRVGVEERDCVPHYCVFYLFIYFFPPAGLWIGSTDLPHAMLPLLPLGFQHVLFPFPIPFPYCLSFSIWAQELESILTFILGVTKILSDIFLPPFYTAAGRTFCQLSQQASQSFVPSAYRFPPALNVWSYP